MKSLKLGLVPSPDLPAEVIGKIVDDLPELLANQFPGDTEWEPEVVVDPLIGSAEYMNKLMDKIIHLKNQNNWDYMICLTDLPHFTGKHVIMSDINRDQKVTIISIPSFGLFPLKRRIKQTICQVLKDMYHDPSKESISSKQKPMTRRAYHKEQKQSKGAPFKATQRINMHSTAKESQVDDKRDVTAEEKQSSHEKEDEKTQENTEQRVDTRYIIRSKPRGQMRILSGMVLANRPWRALSSFKKVLMLAFGTGIYITIFPTPWKLSTVYSIPRFSLLMIAAMIAMVVWMIFAHNLWEKPTKKGDVRLRKLYNITTASTLSVITFINYITLFCLFLITLYLFVPTDLFKSSTDIDGDATFIYYVQLTWLSTSLGTLAGSIGTASEDEDTIREITYSYRQINRNYEIQDNNKEK